MTLDTGYPLAEEFYIKITGFHLAVMTYRLSIPKTSFTMSQQGKISGKTAG